MTRLTPTGAYIRTLRPPPPASVVSVILQPMERGPLPPICARVVSSELDPSSPLGCGFDVVFTSMSRRAEETLYETLDELGLPRDPLPVPAGERRGRPRVWVDVEPIARIEAPSGSRTARIANLNLGGAMLVFGKGDDLSGFAPGTTMPIDIVLESVPEVLSLQAVVVRRTGPGEPHGLGIRFIGLSSVARARVEGVLLHVLGRYFRGYRVPR